MNLSDLKAFEKWFHERVGVSYADAEQRGCWDLRTIKAAYAAGMQRATLETAKLMTRPLEVTLPAPLVQIGWRWVYKHGAFSPVYDGDGPAKDALDRALHSEFGPVIVEKVYVLKQP